MGVVKCPCYAHRYVDRMANDIAVGSAANAANRIGRMPKNSDTTKRPMEINIALNAANPKTCVSIDHDMTRITHDMSNHAI